MDYLKKYQQQLTTRIAIPMLLQGVITLGTAAATFHLFEDHIIAFVVTIGIVYVVGALFVGAFLLRYSIEPLRNLWKAIQYVSPHGNQETAPDLSNLRIGQEMVSTLANNVYQLASVVDSVEKTQKIQVHDIHASFVANALPLPLLVLDASEKIIYANAAAATYFKVPAADLPGQDFNTAFDMSFSSEDTFDSWLKEVNVSSVTADRQWEHVRIGLPGQGDSKQFDLAAHYNKGNPMGYETLLVFFDHSEVYSQDDQAMSFVAVTVHELRTPLTLLRGYIEVFNDEVGPTLSPDLKQFMEKMDANAQQLTAFVNNILNVAKIEDNQLTLQLHEENWADVLTGVVNDVGVRARVRGITIKMDIAKDLPTVGVDRYSIYEVISNLIDNAVKYSKGTNEIYLSASLNTDGLVETSVKDFGLGIDATVLPHVFEKFYRNHRNRAQIGGTGLGLYLSHAIVQAHGGDIWVKSKENEGSTFTFTILPFAKLSEAGKTGTTGGVVRGAHGWIKNHSFYKG